MIDIDVSKIVSEIGEPTARLIEDEGEKRHRLMTFIFCSVFLFLIIIGIVLFYILDFNVKKASAKLGEDTKSLQEENEKLASTEKEAIFIKQRNTDALSLILNNPNWSLVLEELEKIVPSRSITFSSFDVSSPEEMRISGVGSDYSSVSKLVVSMSDFTVKDKDGKDAKVFDNVKLDSASLKKGKDNITSVDFAISFSFIKKMSRDSITPLNNSSATNPTPSQETAAPSTNNSGSENTPTQNQPATQSQPSGSTTTQTPETTNTPPTQNQNNSGLPVL